MTTGEAPQWAQERDKPTLLTIDPNGLWRRQRFEFCNYLEAALGEDDGKAWAGLERMGVRRAQPDTGKE